jgi:pSer/pThr/pTyr-binding forkhead associated (FHA) protein
VDTKGFLTQIRASAREKFVENMPHPFLLITQRPEEVEMAFETLPAQKRTTRSHVEILEIKKAPTNPYPDRISIGRARNCDVVLKDPSVSKLHAHFLIRRAGSELVDLGSQNGTCVNGAPLDRDRAHSLRFGDVLLFGNLAAKFVDAALLYDLVKFLR